MALLLVVGGAIYANSVDGPFVFDDGVSIVTNGSIRTWSSRLLAAGREVPTAGRPLVNLSMAVNYALGGLAVRGYHLWNIGCHLLCAIVLLMAARRALLHARVPDWLRQSAANVALVIALIWMVHPLNSEVVDYLTERSESMMALAFLITMYASDRALGSKRRRL